MAFRHSRRFQAVAEDPHFACAAGRLHIEQSRVMKKREEALGVVPQHAQTYGEAVDAVTLVPSVREAFMAGDRG